VSEPPVSVVLDGRPLYAAVPARLVAGTVLAPLAPFVCALAQRISIDRGAASITFESRDRRVTMGLPPEGEAALVPLAAAARALGDLVRYDAASHTLSIQSPAPAPLATLTPFAGYSPPPGPLPTFTPTPVPTPRPTVTGIPQPRRTPIVLSAPWRE
jgi:hypothetical protein